MRPIALSKKKKWCCTKLIVEHFWSVKLILVLLLIGRVLLLHAIGYHSVELDSNCYTVIVNNLTPYSIFAVCCVSICLLPIIVVSAKVSLASSIGHFTNNSLL